MLLCLLKSFVPFFKMKLYEFFSQAGADVNGGNLASPLVIATMRGGYTNEVRLLLKAGADPNIPDDVYFLYIFLMFFRYYFLICFVNGSYDTVHYSASILCSGSVLLMIFTTLTRHCTCAYARGISFLIFHCISL